MANEVSAIQEQVVEILVEKVYRSPHQPRETFDDTKLEELASSIRENGLLQPIVVRVLNEADGTFELIAGERRLRAHKRLEREKIPAIVRNLTSEEARPLVLIENLQREDLTVLEEARCLNSLAVEYNGDRAQVAKKLGKSLLYVNERIALLALPNEVQRLLEARKINLAQIRVITELKDEEAKVKAAQLATKLNLTANQLRGRVQQKIEKKGKVTNNRSGVRFEQVSQGLVRLYDSLEGYNFEFLGDANKKLTLRKQIELVQRSLMGALTKLDQPVQSGSGILRNADGEDKETRV